MVKNEVVNAGYALRSFAADAPELSREKALAIVGGSTQDPLNIYDPEDRDDIDALFDEHNTPDLNGGPQDHWDNEFIEVDDQGNVMGIYGGTAGDMNPYDHNISRDEWDANKETGNFYIQ